jgi:hypothetical protein
MANAKYRASETWLLNLRACWCCGTSSRDLPPETCSLRLFRTHSILDPSLQPRSQDCRDRRPLNLKPLHPVQYLTLAVVVKMLLHNQPMTRASQAIPPVADWSWTECIALERIRRGDVASGHASNTRKGPVQAAGCPLCLISAASLDSRRAGRGGSQPDCRRRWWELFQP